MTPQKPFHIDQLWQNYGWQPDAAQLAFLECAQTWLNGQKPGKSPSKWRSIFPFLSQKSMEFPRGFYLYGAVGRGKTMLMQAVEKICPFGPKKQIHFNDFMQDVHQKLHHYRQDATYPQPLDGVIHELSRTCRFLFLDEFQVHEIADAMILSRLFEGLISAGVYVMMTSNQAPDTLYQGGLHYDRFRPFIDFIHQTLYVYHLENKNFQDYRQTKERPRQVYFQATNPQDQQMAADLFAHFSGNKAVPFSLTINQRQLFIPLATPLIARFGFHDLCGQALGTADYSAIARKFPILFIENIPIFNAEMGNEARRFMLLIDTLYDQKNRIILTLTTDIAHLYQDNRPQALAFERTISRLIEMQTHSYWATAKNSPL